MDRYRVLLVDDEEEIRMGISRKIDWDSLGFSLVGEAENGADALELAEQLRPDVVLTDIKMPFMDGLELCRRLRNQLPASKLVVFSGFDDFEYARKAIGIHVSEYILKPINAPELRQVLLSLKEQLDNQRTERQDMEALRRRYEESLPVLRDLFFTRLLDGHISMEQVADRAARYELQLDEGHWMTVLIQVEDTSVDALDRDELLLLSVRAFVQEHLTLDRCQFHFILYNDWVAVLANLPNEDIIYPFIDELTRICTLATSFLGATLTVGMGRPCLHPHALNISAVDARNALDYRVLIGAGRTIYIGDLEPAGTAPLSFSDSDERELSAAVKLGTVEQIQELISTYMRQVRAAGLALPQCQFFFLELVTSLVKLARTGGIEPESVFGEGFTGVFRLTDFSSREEVGNWYCECCLRLRELLQLQRTDSTGRTIEKARHFIAERYGDIDLNVDTLCSHLHLSPAYFSTLFKREVGMSFTAYVTNVRMAAATDLLQNTDAKTYLIAEQIGYADPNYFSYVFKRHFGTSPTKYRSQ